MNQITSSKICVARIVIQTTSPLAINSGKRETNFDTALVRDVNGLPYIPATAIAGVWSHLVERYLGEETRQFWFGKSITKTQDNENVSARASRLSISHGILHNAKNQAITPYLSDNEKNDDILRICALDRPYHRERVSINDRGVAKDTGKFDQVILPKGLRFSIQVRWAQQENDDYKAIFALWNEREMAFGSSTTNGFGAFDIITSEIKEFDLSKGSEEGKKLNQFVNKLTHSTTKEIESFSEGKEKQLLASLPLKAIDNWRCGSGSELIDPTKLKSTDEKTHKVAIISYSEPCWEWKDNKAIWQAKGKPILTGSSIKGILAHRIAFHYRCQTQEWAEDVKDVSIEEMANYQKVEPHISLEKATHKKWETKPDALNNLFGYADEHNHINSKAGILIVDDCEIKDPETIIRYHNSIDRFTGGVRKGALYSEELIYQPEFTLKIWLRANKTIEPNLLQAVKNTLDDLENGLLPMGAGSGRGNSLVRKNGEFVFDETPFKSKSEEASQ